MPSRGSGSLAKRKKTGDAKHGEFTASLAREEVLLLRLRDELYEGSWADLRADLERRKAGEPYLFKLAGRIEDDLERIERLEAYERKNGVDLAEYL